MKCLKKILIILFLSISVYSSGQNQIKSDTIINMKEAVIVSNRILQYTSASKIQTIDTFALINNKSNTLSDIISSQSLVQINSYGAGATSGPSFRGTGGAHTAVLWNGFDLNDVLNGGVDFSQIPVFFLDDVKLQFGGCSALYGSGAIGGSVNLNNNLLFDQGIVTSVMASYGSFSNHFEGIEFKVSKEKSAIAIRIFNHYSKNDFDYSNKYQPGSPIQKLYNSQTLQQGALIDNCFFINKNQKLNIHIWLQSNDHNIPSQMIDTSISKQNQKDQFIRPSVEWAMIKNKTSFFMRTGYFFNNEYYKDPANDLNSEYRSISSISEFENNYRFNMNFKLNSGINYTHEKGESPSLDKTHIRDRSTIFSSLKYNLKNNRFNAILSLREEIVNSNNTPLTYSAGIDGQILKGLNVKGNINKSYRIPSFNDLYWNDMAWNMFGNPDLKNEEGLNEELNLDYHLIKNIFSGELGLTAFNSNISNWILWEPIDNFSKWMPMNVDTVWSRGLEFSIDLSIHKKDLLINLTGMLTILKTTNESKSADSAVKHKQLIYVPNQKNVANIFIKYKKFSFTYSYNYIGSRFTNAENTEYVNGFPISNIILSKEFGFQKFSLNLDLHINNIWNKEYEVMQYYPMPKRNFEVGLKISFNKPSK